MILIRDIMYCKPGKVRPMVEKFRALNTLMKKNGHGSMRIMTDLSAERYWTVVSEMEVKSLEDFTKEMESTMQDKEFEEAMKGYHDLVESGRREMYTLEE